MGRVSDQELRLLRIFQAIAESRGLAAAELRLGISRSTISTHLSMLEARLGLRLCKRGRAGFALTEDGNKVYRATIELMRALGEFQEEVSSLGDHPRSNLKVAILDSMIWLKKLRITDGLNEFVQKNRNVKIEMSIHHPNEIEKRVLEGSIDIAITSVYENSRKLAYIPLTTATSFLYCGARNRLFDLGDENISEADLMNTPYTSKWFDESPVLLGQGNSLVHAEAFHIEATAHLILSGHYVGFLPEYYAKLWVDRGEMKMVRPDLYKLVYRYGFSMRQGRDLSPAAQSFIDSISSWAKRRSEA